MFRSLKLPINTNSCNWCIGVRRSMFEDLRPWSKLSQWLSYDDWGIQGETEKIYTVHLFSIVFTCGYEANCRLNNLLWANVVSVFSPHLKGHKTTGSFTTYTIQAQIRRFQVKVLIRRELNQWQCTCIIYCQQSCPALDMETFKSFVDKRHFFASHLRSDTDTATSFAICRKCKSPSTNGHLGLALALHRVLIELNLRLRHTCAFIPLFIFSFTNFSPWLSSLFQRSAIIRIFKIQLHAGYFQDTLSALY